MKYLMMSRESVQTLLEGVLGSDHVYFQAPPNTGMQYPCIVYNFVRPYVRHANNKPYIVTGYWEIQHMYKSVKNDLKETMLFVAPYIAFDRRLKKDGVYNDYYTLYK